MSRTVFFLCFARLLLLFVVIFLLYSFSFPFYFAILFNPFPADILFFFQVAAFTILLSYLCLISLWSRVTRLDCSWLTCECTRVHTERKICRMSQHISDDDDVYRIPPPLVKIYYRKIKRKRRNVCFCVLYMYTMCGNSKKKVLNELGTALVCLSTHHYTTHTDKHASRHQ